MRILSEMYPWTRKSPLNFGSELRVRIQTHDQNMINLGRGMCSPSAVVL